MITMAYKLNKLKGIEILERTITTLSICDDHELNKETIRLCIEALQQLSRNEELMLEYAALIAGIKEDQPIDEIEKEEGLA